MISSILSRLGVFDNGSVWALYLLHVIIRTDLSCSLGILSELKAHDDTKYCRWGRIKLLYKILNIFWGKYRFNLHIISSDFDILLDIFVHVHSMSNADRLSNLRRGWSNSPMFLFFCYHVQCQKLGKYLQVQRTSYFWTLQSFQIFTGLLFHIKLHLLSTVLFHRALKSWSISQVWRAS